MTVCLPFLHHNDNYDIIVHYLGECVAKELTKNMYNIVDLR